jgi:hypothetical protein
MRVKPCLDSFVLLCPDSTVCFQSVGQLHVWLGFAYALTLCRPLLRLTRLIYIASLVFHIANDASHGVAEYR